VEMSLARIREWMRANPQSAEEVLRQNRSFVFFRIVGLSDDREPKDARDASHDREAVGAQGVPLTPGRSIAVDNALQGPSHLQNWTAAATPLNSKFQGSPTCGQFWIEGDPVALQ
jgi:membrane-bound lytic murein transglycosylase